MIRRLAALNWPLAKIAEPLGISSEQFVDAVARCPRIKTEFDAGLEDLAAYIQKAASWQPTVSDIEQVEALAAKGYGPVEVAAALKVSRSTFARRLEDSAPLRQAMELGEGRYRTELIELSEEMLKNRDPDLRFVGQLLIFKLKAYCQLGESKPVLIQGKVEHSLKLNAPPVVPIENIHQYAVLEMERAAKLRIPDNIADN